MHLWKIVLAITATGMVAGCGSNKQTPEVDTEGAPATSADDTAAPEPEPELEGIAKQGKIAFLKCRSCHTVKKDDVHLTGPNLHGLIGAAAGEKEGYSFSDSLKSSNIDWNDENLDKWIEQPRSVIPGNKMVFAGIPNKEERAALIAYLKEATK